MTKDDWPDIDTAMRELKMTDRQRLFCVAYMADLNTAKAVRAAGYAESSKAIGPRLLTSPKIKRMLHWLRNKHAAKAEITMDLIREKHLKIYDTAMAMGDLTNANRAVEGLGKTIGAYTDRVHFDGPPQITIVRKVAPNPAIEAEFEEVPETPQLQ